VFQPPSVPTAPLASPPPPPKRKDRSNSAPPPHRMPSIVREVSAMLVASTTLRAPGGVGSKMRAWGGGRFGER
jgi:hypothetical protein